MEQKPSDTTTGVIKLSMEGPTNPTKILLNVCVWAPIGLRIWCHTTKTGKGLSFIYILARFHIGGRSKINCISVLFVELIVRIF